MTQTAHVLIGITVQSKFLRRKQVMSNAQIYRRREFVPHAGCVLMVSTCIVVPLHRPSRDEPS